MHRVILLHAYAGGARTAAASASDVATVARGSELALGRHGALGHARRSREQLLLVVPGQLLMRRSSLLAAPAQRARAGGDDGTAGDMCRHQGVLSLSIPRRALASTSSVNLQE